VGQNLQIFAPWNVGDTDRAPSDMRYKIAPHFDILAKVAQRAPPIFGWAAITLCVGPHSSCSSFANFLLWFRLPVNFLTHVMHFRILRYVVSQLVSEFRRYEIIRSWHVLDVCTLQLLDSMPVQVRRTIPSQWVTWTTDKERQHMKRWTWMHNILWTTNIYHRRGDKTTITTTSIVQLAPTT